MRYKHHCSPAIKTKLKSMIECEATVRGQHYLGLLGILKKIYFKQDRLKQKLTEIVETKKMIILCWQHLWTTINEYTCEFKAQVQM